MATFSWIGGTNDDGELISGGSVGRPPRNPYAKEEDERRGCGGCLVLLFLPTLLAIAGTAVALA